MPDPLHPPGPVFDEPAFRQLLTREANRSSGYRDFFALCLVMPDTSGEPDELLLETAFAELLRLLRATDLVGRIQGVIGVLLINTPPGEAVLTAAASTVCCAPEPPRSAKFNRRGIPTAGPPALSRRRAHLRSRVRSRDVRV